MKSQGSIQRKTACNTCPFLLAMKMPLDRETLERTVVNNLTGGYIHPCHTNRTNMCTGYLSFVHHKQQETGGLASLMAGRVGIAERLINTENIPELEIFNTIDEMLEKHDEIQWSNRH